tara:strand:- start:393 stop:749 length:357 start_codon:yes stop_codon:yes gene_type:complete
MKKIGIIALMSVLMAADNEHLNEFVTHYLLLTQSKMMDSPTVWQDVRQGYLRNEAIYFSDVLMDSMETGLSSYDVVVKHISKVDQLRQEVSEGEDFDYKIIVPPPPMANVNYFSSSSK